jgi:hypothetical protein
MILERLGWEPSTSLASGIEATYGWIYDDLRARAPIGTVQGLGGGTRSAGGGQATATETA